MPESNRNRFLKAYEIASNTNKKLPPDIMLHFYSYYKRATEQNGFYIPPSDGGDLRSAFKINALFQVKNLTKEEAEQRYIDLVEEHIGKVPE
ncbi:acyl-CoA-binding protein [Zunongwangia endophytica]|uniref:Acyl-CoA-binding protein n=1 Tax=Zunongwangia endophytica TaxID=1808945 RepID=A0ABV8H4T3_9FLAO|nr:acyl-CoA-binding protein [Zunongwangia endophytica]MDN3596554.1 acyl-CoA-binding protein [Zunongwangia endophytica]